MAKSETHTGRGKKYMAHSGLNFRLGYGLVFVNVKKVRAQTSGYCEA